MKYEFSINLFDGDRILIDAKEREKIEQALRAGHQWISCGESFINAKNISSVGPHGSAAQIKTLKRSTNEIKLAGLNPGQHKKLMALKKQKAIKSATDENLSDYEKLVGTKIKEIEALPMPDEEKIDTTPDREYKDFTTRHEK